MNSPKGLRKPLQQQMGGVFLLLAIAFGVAGYSFQRVLVHPAFEKMERGAAIADLDRVRELFDAELASMAVLSTEYSEWTPTYDYVSGLLPDYIDLHVSPESWYSQNVEMMLFFTREGSLVWGRIAEPSTGQILAVDLETQGPLPVLRDILSNSPEQQSLLGFVELHGGTMLVTAMPVLRNDLSGPPAGYYVMGRYLTEERLAALQKRAGVSFSLIPSPLVFEPGEPGSYSLAQNFSSGSINLDYAEDYVAGSEIWRDLAGLHSLLVEVRTPREISAIGNEILDMAAIFMACLSLLFVLSSWGLIRLLVTAPIDRLKSHMGEIMRTRDLSLSLELNRNDELGDLAHEFDVMKSALQLTQSELEITRDEALSSAKSKSEFLASMSHEIRTPMNGVIGMTDLLFKTDLSEAQLRLVNTVKTSARSLLSIINDILDFSKIDAGKMLVEEKVFALDRLVTEVNAVVTEPAQRKGLEYICRLSSQLPQGIVSDEHRLRQVLVNLIGNALKFTESGEVVLSATTVRTWSERGEDWGVLRFSVSDTGIGISKSLQSKIFTSFSQADSSTTRKYGGTGLGLSISKQLVELMGGKIGFQSTKGKGSNFWFTLPVRFVQLAADDIAKEPDLPKGLRALLVDDNATNREVLNSHMSSWNCYSEVCCSAAEALLALERARLENWHYDLMIVDYHMPEMDGLMLAEQVTQNEDFGQPVIIILSSVSEQFSSQELADCGVRSYLSKPILRDELYRQICRAMAADVLPRDAPLHSEATVHKSPKEKPLHADVLVAEDNAVNQELITLLLEDIGCVVVLTDNGQLAIAELETRPFDLVIMDCQMPIMDGFEASRIIRQNDIRAKNGDPIPILALTANAMDGDQERCIAAGMDSYLAKPFDNSGLVTVLRAMVGQGTPSACLDTAALDQVRALQREGRPDLGNRLIDAYLETSPGLVLALREGISSKDEKAVELNAHSLKSSSAALGATELSSICADIEKKARAAAIDDVHLVLDRLGSEFDLVCQALTQERQVEY